MKRLGFLLLLCFIGLVSVSQNYIPVDQGSKVHFVIKNFGINTGGDLTGLQGNISFDPAQLSQSVFQVTVKAGTVDTDNGIRDKSLGESDYFDVVNFPQVKLVSTKIDRTNKTDEGYYFFTGQLIIKGVSKPISFPFQAEKKAGGYLFTGDLSINRLDYGVGNGSAVLSNKVVVSLKVYAKPK